MDDLDLSGYSPKGIAAYKRPIYVCGTVNGSVLKLLDLMTRCIAIAGRILEAVLEIRKTFEKQMDHPG